MLLSYLYNCILDLKKKVVFFCGVGVMFSNTGVIQFSFTSAKNEWKAGYVPRVVGVHAKP